MGKLDVTLKTKGLRGKVGRSVTLTTNDPAREKTRLTIQAEITGSVVLLPYNELSVGSARGRHQRNRLILRKDPTEEGELVVSNLATRVEWLRPTVRKVDTEEPGADGFPTALPGDWVLEVELDESAPAGSIRIPVEFDTGLNREPRVTVQVLVGVIPAVTVKPSSLELVPSGSGEGAEGVIHAVVRAGLDPESLVIEATSDAVQLETTKTGPRHFRVRAAFPESALDEEALKLVFSVANAGQVEVPVLTGVVPGSTPEMAP